MMVGIHPISITCHFVYSHYVNEPEQNQSPSAEEVAICAYLIWKHEGQPEGLDKVH
jgi:hypothetical protein